VRSKVDENLFLELAIHIIEYGNKVLKLDALTTFRRSDYILHTLLNNKYLTPVSCGQFIPAISGQSIWFF